MRVWANAKVEFRPVGPAPDLNETEIIDQTDVNPDPSELRTWRHFGSVTLGIQGCMEQKPDGTWEGRGTRRLYIVEAYLEP